MILSSPNASRMTSRKMRRRRLSSDASSSAEETAEETVLDRPERAFAAVSFAACAVVVAREGTAVDVSASAARGLAVVLEIERGDSLM